MATTLRKLVRALEVHNNEDQQAKESGTNFDARPLEPARRTYGVWEFVTLWIVTGSFNIGGWNVGSSLIALGLNVWQAMITVILGNIIVGLLCVMTGAPGARWHVGFPIIQRSSWGVHGYVIVVIQRIFLGCIWYSTQVYWGGQCVKVFLTALWPSFARIDTPLANGTMTTGDFTSFIIFTVLYYPLIWVKPEKYKVPFLVSCAVVIPTIFATWIWFMVKAKGGGAFLTDLTSLSSVTPATGSHLGWMIVLGIITNIGNMSVHIYVQSDYGRYARKPSDQVLPQLIIIPFGAIVVGLIGIICASCAAEIFPEEKGTLLWEPYSLYAAIQSHYHNSSRSRAAVAFGSLSFMVGQFGMVVANNGVGSGIDLTSLFPRFFTIRRGMILMSAVSFIVQPWELLNGASKFLTVLGGYGVFLGPMTGVMFADYFLVRSRQLKLTDLYERSPRSIYWYWKGFNWRAIVAWLMGIWISLPGFAEYVRYGTSRELKGWSHLYDISYLLGCLISLVTYYVLHRLSPIKGIGVIDETDYFGTFGSAPGSIPDKDDDHSDVQSATGHDVPFSLKSPSGSPTKY